MSNLLDGGFISINRKILEWEWYSDNNVKSLFVHCLLKANFKQKSWKGQNIERGTFITSYGILSNELNLSVKQIRTAFGKLIKTNEIITKGTNKNTTVTVVKYDTYQIQGQLKGNQKAIKGQSKGNQRATTNKDNKDNKDNKEVKDIYRSFEHLSITKEQFDKLNEQYEIKIIDRVLDNIENYKNNKNYKNLFFTARNWLAKEPKKKIVEQSEKRINRTWSSTNSKKINNTL